MGSEIVITSPPVNEAISFAATLLTIHDTFMQILPCAAPTETLENAPLTDMSVHMPVPVADLQAFWGTDDRYYLRAQDATGAESWFIGNVEAAGEALVSADEAALFTAQLATVLPLAAGKPAFAIGSAGRTVYRVWRTQTADNQGRTKIRAVRAGRSRRLPA